MVLRVRDFWPMFKKEFMLMSSWEALAKPLEETSFGLVELNCSDFYVWPSAISGYCNT